jgi:hypothetical protein
MHARSHTPSPSRSPWAGGSGKGSSAAERLSGLLRLKGRSPQTLLSDPTDAAWLSYKPACRADREVLARLATPKPVCDGLCDEFVMRAWARVLLNPAGLATVLRGKLANQSCTLVCPLSRGGISFEAGRSLFRRALQTALFHANPR